MASLVAAGSAKGVSEGFAEVIVGDDSTIVAVEASGPWSSLPWTSLVGRLLPEVIVGGDAPLSPLLRGESALLTLGLELDLGDPPVPVIAELRRIGGHVLARLEPRSAAADEVSTERMAEHRLEEIGVLVSGIAHDFNNVLSAILGNAELLAEELDDVLAADPDLAAAVADIATAADRSRDLIAQMLGYGTRAPRSQQGAIDLSALTREMARLLRVSIPQSVTFSFVIDDAVPLVVGDASQLRQVIMNLIVNAADAIGDDVGGIALRTGTLFADRALLSAGHAGPDVVEGDYVFVEVEDSGCGMDEATLARIFDAFFTTKKKGRGLGLAGVRAIVEAHRGALLVHSTPGIGTIFRVLLPAEGSLARSSSSSGSLAFVHLEGVRVMVVDDEPMIRRVTARLLQSRGAAVTCAADGHEALELLVDDPSAFECVLLNVSMPYVSGIDVAEEMLGLRPDLPVLLISGYSVEEIQRRVSDLPIRGILPKPFTSGDLFEAVRGLLPRRP
ncbi:MAG: response regulator [Myxococcales bacterium]|nr:response regulator [Myxococcales bacterium]